MSNDQSQGFDAPEEELAPLTKPLQIPLAFRLVVTFATGAVFVACVYYFARYVDTPKEYAAPSDLGLTTILLFSAGLLLIVWVPWQSLGLRISKIGGLEFQQVVDGQASEHAADLGELESRIEDLERFMSQDEGVKIGEEFRSPALRKLLIDFLATYETWAFSPSRIKAWGAAQPGYSELSTFAHGHIKRTLQQLVSEGKVVTRVSKKGNTLYRLP